MLSSDSTVDCWGANHAGQLGQEDDRHRINTSSSFRSDLRVDVGGDVADLSVSDHVCVLLTDGSVKCWGDNTLANLGVGDRENRGDGRGEMGAALPVVDLVPYEHPPDPNSGCYQCPSGIVCVSNIESFPGLLAQEDQTADPGLATDLAAIEAEDDAWYGLIVVDGHSKAQINAAAAWAEARRVLYACTSADDAIKDPGSSDDVFSTLDSSNYARTLPLFHPNADNSM